MEGNWRPDELFNLNNYRDPSKRRPQSSAASPPRAPLNPFSLPSQPWRAANALQKQSHSSGYPRENYSMADALTGNLPTARTMNLAAAFVDPTPHIGMSSPLNISTPVTSANSYASPPTNIQPTWYSAETPVCTTAPLNLPSTGSLYGSLAAVLKRFETLTSQQDAMYKRVEEALSKQRLNPAEATTHSQRDDGDQDKGTKAAMQALGVLAERMQTFGQDITAIRNVLGIPNTDNERELGEGARHMMKRRRTHAPASTTAARPTASTGTTTKVIIDVDALDEMDEHETGAKNGPKQRTILERLDSMEADFAEFMERVRDPDANLDDLRGHSSNTRISSLDQVVRRTTRDIGLSPRPTSPDPAPTTLNKGVTHRAPELMDVIPTAAGIQSLPRVFRASLNASSARLALSAPTENRALNDGDTSTSPPIIKNASNLTKTAAAREERTLPRRTEQLSESSEVDIVEIVSIIPPHKAQVPLDAVDKNSALPASRGAHGIRSSTSIPLSAPPFKINAAPQVQEQAEVLPVMSKNAPVHDLATSLTLPGGAGLSLWPDNKSFDTRAEDDSHTRPPVDESPTNKPSSALTTEETPVARRTPDSLESVPLPGRANVGNELPIVNAGPRDVPMSLPSIEILTPPLNVASDDDDPPSIIKKMRLTPASKAPTAPRNINPFAVKVPSTSRSSNPFSGNASHASGSNPFAGSAPSTSRSSNPSSGKTLKLAHAPKTPSSNPSNAISSPSATPQRPAPTITPLRQSKLGPGLKPMYDTLSTPSLIPPTPAKSRPSDIAKSSNSKVPSTPIKSAKSGPSAQRKEKSAPVIVGDDTPAREDAQPRQKRRKLASSADIDAPPNNSALTPIKTGSSQPSELKAGHEKAKLSSSSKDLRRKMKHDMQNALLRGLRGVKTDVHGRGAGDDLQSSTSVQGNSRSPSTVSSTGAVVGIDTVKAVPMPVKSNSFKWTPEARGDRDSAKLAGTSKDLKRKRKHDPDPDDLPSIPAPTPASYQRPSMPSLDSSSRRSTSQQRKTFPFSKPSPGAALDISKVKFGPPRKSQPASEDSPAPDGLVSAKPRAALDRD